MNITTPSMQQLLEAGVHFGHQVRRGNPRMQEYIYGSRDGVHIINLEDSERLLKEAAEFAYKLGEEGKILLIVGTKKQAQLIISEAAKNCGAFYITSKWIGGLLTNFDEIRKNISKLNDLKSQQVKGELDRYTKKEQLIISRKLHKFESEYGGIAQMDRLPDVVFLTDCVTEKTALTEANRIGMTVIGICDTNSNPALVDYPIPGNDDATKAIKIMVDALSQGYGEGLKKAQKLIAKAQADEAQEKADNIHADNKTSDTEDMSGSVQNITEEVAAAEEEIEKKEVKDAERVV